MPAGELPNENVPPPPETEYGSMISNLGLTVNTLKDIDDLFSIRILVICPEMLFR